jgi:hypothetical protein
MSTDVTAADLSEILAIRQLKARYCRLLDAKDWQGWRGVFADEFVMDLSQAGGAVVQGSDAFVAYTRKNVGKPSQITVHQVHAPEIELTSANTAQGGVGAERHRALRARTHYERLRALARDLRKPGRNLAHHFIQTHPAT